MKEKNVSETACKYLDWLEESKVGKLQTIESLLNKTCLRSSSEIIDSTMQLNLGFWKNSLMGQFFFIQSDSREVNLAVFIEQHRIIWEVRAYQSVSWLR